jgi:hypothetical protein
LNINQIFFRRWSQSQGGYKKRIHNADIIKGLRQSRNPGKGEYYERKN